LNLHYKLAAEPFSVLGTYVQVFVNIRDDEIEHKKTMKACQSTDIAKDIANADKRYNN